MYRMYVCMYVCLYVCIACLVLICVARRIVCLVAPLVGQLTVAAGLRAFDRRQDAFLRLRPEVAPAACSHDPLVLGGHVSPS